MYITNQRSFVNDNFIQNRSISDRREVKKMYSCALTSMTGFAAILVTLICMAVFLVCLVEYSLEDIEDIIDSNINATAESDLHAISWKRF